MEVCKTDMQKIIKYLDDAAIMYDNHPDNVMYVAHG